MDALLGNKWTLESDRLLFELLQDMSRATIERASACATQLKALNERLESTERSLRDASNRLAALKNVQFVDCQVVEVLGGSDSNQEETTRALRKTTSSEPAGDAAQLMTGPGALRGEEVDLFADRPLPHIIGSGAFRNDPYAGLRDLSLHDDEPVFVAEEPAETRVWDEQAKIEARQHEVQARAVFDFPPPPGYNENTNQPILPSLQTTSTSQMPSFTLVPEEPHPSTRPKEDDSAAYVATAVQPPLSVAKLPDVPVRPLAVPSVTLPSNTKEEEDDDDLFTAVPFQATAPLPTVVSTTVSSTAAHSVTTSAPNLITTTTTTAPTAASLPQRGPPPPPPARTTRNLFEDDDDDEANLFMHPVTVPIVVQASAPMPALPPKDDRSTLPDASREEARELKVAARAEAQAQIKTIETITPPANPVQQGPSVAPPKPSSQGLIAEKKPPIKRKALFDDDDDDEEDDDGLVYS